MRQSRWTEDSIEVVEVEPPKLEPGWVRLSVSACGICGSDLHMLRREMPAIPGATPGHEMVGTVLDGPAGLGDSLYAIEPRAWCGACEFCGLEKQHLCERGDLFGISLPGGLADFVDVPREALHRVDPSVSPLVASISEPLAVCVRAVRLAEIAATSRVLVMGGGSIGLLAGWVARDRARSVGVTARHPHQRAAAEALGLEPVAEDDLSAWCADKRPDVVIETVGGRSDTINTAILNCRAAARVVVLGVFSWSPPINAMALMAKEVCLIGSNTYGHEGGRSDFAEAVKLLPRCASEIASLQTHQFELEKLEDAFACADDKSSGAIKVTLIP